MIDRVMIRSKIGEFIGSLTSGSGLQGAQRSIRLHLIIGLAVVAVLAGGLGGWASTQEISGALIAPGQIVSGADAAHTADGAAARRPAVHSTHPKAVRSTAFNAQHRSAAHRSSNHARH